MTVEDGVARGPGVADMKGGLLLALTAMEALAAGPRAFASVELHSVPDEEVRVVPFATIDALTGTDAVLVLECGRENGDFVSGRKTGAWLRLAVEGVAAHAGTEPGLGRSAILGLCREVLRVSELDGARPGLTVIAGTIAGGTIANVVPQHARDGDRRARAGPERLRMGSAGDRSYRRLRRVERGCGESGDMAGDPEHACGRPPARVRREARQRPRARRRRADDRWHVGRLLDRSRGAAYARRARPSRRTRPLTIRIHPAGFGAASVWHPGGALHGHWRRAARPGSFSGG